MNNKIKNKIDGFEMNKYFSNCSIPYITTDGRLMAINDKYLAMPWIVPGEINIVKSNKPRNLAFNNYARYKQENSIFLIWNFHHSIEMFWPILLIIILLLLMMAYFVPELSHQYL
jgi:hypothetical protein